MSRPDTAQLPGAWHLSYETCTARATRRSKRHESVTAPHVPLRRLPLLVRRHRHHLPARATPAGPAPNPPS